MRYFNRKTRALSNKKPSRFLAFAEQFDTFTKREFNKKVPLIVNSEVVEYEDKDLTAAQKTKLENFIKKNG